MATPYVGEIRMFAGNFAPAGWMLCQGQLISISENEVLFQLIGTTYGGDGQVTFALPNLSGRTPVHMGTSLADGRTYVIGEMAGVENVTLNVNQLPSHTHTLLASADPATDTTPSQNVAPARAVGNIYDIGADTTLSPQAVSAVGGSQPHENMQPFLVINYIISMFGIFPSQT
jgi:microcystin-dependent protein